MEIATIVLVIACLCTWLFAVVNAVLAVANRKPEESLGSFLISGLKLFDDENFTEAGQKYQRRFMLGFAVFFLMGFLTAAASLAMTSMTQ